MDPDVADLIGIDDDTDDETPDFSDLFDGLR
jgi:hypothetical protein